MGINRRDKYFDGFDGKDGELTMKEKRLARINLLGFAVLVVMNYLIAAGKIPGLLSQKEVSGIYQTSITPPGFTFSIWGLIYLLLFAALIYMLKVSEDARRSSVIREITPSLWGVYIFNLLWNLVFSLQWIGASLFMIAGYFLSLIAIGVKLRLAQDEVAPVYPLAFGIHTGWIAIASIVNLYAYLVKIDLEAFGKADDLRTTAALAAALVLALLLQLLLRNAVLPLSIAWAYWGIYSRGETYTAYPYIPLMILVAVAILWLMAAMTLVKNKYALTD